MSDFGFFSYEEKIDPVEQSQKTAKAVESVRRELEDRGIFAFVMMADSLPEAEQRLAMRDVDLTIDDVIARYMPGDEGAKARLVSNIFKQFEALKQVEAEDKMPMKDGKLAFLSDEDEDEESNEESDEEDKDKEEEEDDDEEDDSEDDDEDFDDDSDDDDDPKGSK